MDWIWILIAILTTLGVFFYKLRRQIEFKKKIPMIAHMLGLKFSDRADQLPERISQENISLDPENVKTLQKSARVISSWRVEGDFNRVKVQIRPLIIHYDRKNHSAYTRVEAFFRQPLNFGMTISNLGNAPLGKPHIPVERLDGDVIVKAIEESKVLKLVSDSDVQHAITSAIHFSSQVIIDDTGARLDKLGAPHELEYYRNVLDLLTRIILEFEKRL